MKLTVFFYSDRKCVLVIVRTADEIHIKCVISWSSSLNVPLHIRGGDHEEGEDPRITEPEREGGRKGRREGEGVEGFSCRITCLLLNEGSVD